MHKTKGNEKKYTTLERSVSPRVVFMDKKLTVKLKMTKIRENFPKEKKKH